MSPMTTPRAEYLARCLVNGSARHEKTGQVEPVAGAWSSRFKGHPWVEESEAEGWGRELRSACVAGAMKRILAGVRPSDISAEDVMPRWDWIAYARNEARKTREAAEWRRANPDHHAIRGLSEIDPVQFLRRLGIRKPAAARPHAEVIDRETGEIHT